MADDTDRREPPLTRAEINLLSDELRHVRKDLTHQLAEAMELSNRLTDLVVRLLRGVG